MGSFTVRELADLVSGTVEGDPGRRVSGVAAVSAAGPEDLTFVVNSRYERVLARTRPGAALIPVDMATSVAETTLIRVADPQLAFSCLVPLFHPTERRTPCIEPSAVLGKDVRLGEDVSIGPFAVIGDGAFLGAHTVVGAHAVIERAARIGEDCVIGAGCSVMWGVEVGDRVRLHPGVRLGTDGFGYVSGDTGHVKVPQIGGCVIGDDVEIGANSTVDRGAIGDTVIGAGTKIDNLVHIGHNVRIGKQCVIVAQVGVAGSVRIGDEVQLAGQAGIAGHLTIGAGARIAAQAGVIGDVPAGATYSGYPARPHRDSLRASAVLRKLPDLLQRIRRIEKKLDRENK
ncbi:MAG: UDP-3-O-(3-hydroxymyristoyl)glucosamine N-acyltransferase [Gemmatimonadota bacterium]